MFMFSSPVRRYRCALIAAAAVVLTMAGVSKAEVVDYQLGSNSSIDAYHGSNGLQIETDLYNLDGKSFSLDNGDCTTFKFFDIWTNESSIDWSDKQDKTITATLDFDLPDDINVDITGNTSGDKVTQTIVYGHYHYNQTTSLGQVVWDGPVTITLPEVTFTVTLSDETFNPGWCGLKAGPCYGATVEATVCQVSTTPPPDTNSVPTPAALPAGLSLLGIAGMRRRRRRNA